MQDIQDTLARVIPFTAMVALLGLMVYLLQDAGYEQSLRYQRSLFFDEPWRLLTHSLVHANYQHLLLNGSALVLMFALFSEAFNSLAWVFVLAVSAVLSATGLYYLSPDVDWCIGLSGALHGLLVYVLLRVNASIVWLIALAAKVIAEQMPQLEELPWHGVTESFIDVAVVVDAHLWGAIGGLLLFILIRTVTWLNVVIEINRAAQR